MDKSERYRRAIALLDKWAKENNGFDERVEPLIEAALRESAPRHFPTPPERPRKGTAALKTLAQYARGAASLFTWVALIGRRRPLYRFTIPERPTDAEAIAGDWAAVVEEEKKC